MPTRLIGRRSEIASARELLVGDARLVTLTGPPGVGKTSLALALAADLGDRFADGDCFVDLSAVEDAELVAATIADALGFGGRRQPIGRLIAALRRRDLLLMLDNFEQVVTAAPVVAELLAACPRLAIVVTSRVPLRLRWEHELPVPPLQLPDPAWPLAAEAVAGVPAVRLFVERARAVNPAFALTDENVSAVAQVCARLDGLPLAIELAAARARLFTPEALLRQLLVPDGLSGAGPAGRSALGLLTGGPRDLPPRQQTLRDAIAWSHALLTEEERRLFRRLAVFAGGCTLAAIESVCEAAWSDVASLVEKSLLRQDVAPAGAASPAGHEPRVRLLEMLREYALEQLEASGEADAIRRRHVSYYLGLAEEAEPRLVGPEQDVWLRDLSQERDNLRSAGRWALEAGDVESVLRLGAALFRFWRVRGFEAAVQECIDGILAVAPTAPPHPAGVRALSTAAELARVRASYDSARSLYEQSLEVARQLGDHGGVAAALRGLGVLAGMRGQDAELHRLRAECLAMFDDRGDRAPTSKALRELGMISHYAGDQADARSLLERSLALARRLGDQREIADSSFNLAIAHHVMGARDIAWQLYEVCLATDRAHGYRANEAAVLNNLGQLAVARGDLRQARSLIRESVLTNRESGDRRRLGFNLSVLAGLVAAEGEPERAIHLDAAGRAALEAIGARLAPAMRARYDEHLAPAGAALGAAGASAAEAAGRALTLDQAVDEALAWLGEPAAGSEGDESTAGDDGPAAPAATSRPARLSSISGRRMLRRGPDRLADVTPSGPIPLTQREREVAGLIARGYSNQQIAEALVVSKGTAANYVQRVLHRLGLENRVQVAAWAVEHGLRGQGSALDTER